MSHSLEHGNVIKAAGWLLFGVLGGLGLDLCAKQLLETHSLIQFVLLRSTFGILILLAIAPRFGGFQALRTGEVGWHFLRTIFSIGAMFGFFYGLGRMPLVNALTLGYTAPLMVTSLSAVFLGETIGWRRWSAVIVGFVGTLIVLRPDRSALTHAELAILVAAFCYACQAITARRLSGTESTLALSFWVIVGPLVVAASIIDGNDWIPPDATGWLLLVLAAAASVVAWFGFVNGYRAVSPATLAPLEYVAIVLGAIAGYAIWDEIPDRWVVLGALIIIASSVFVVYRGQAAKRRRP